MNLETSAGRSVANPSASQIAEELAALPGGADCYAILSLDDLTYIQTAGRPPEGFLLEYQDGSAERHYRSTERALPLSTVTNAFQLYARSDSSWRSVATWKQQDLSEPSGGSSRLRLALLAAAILALVVWWWRTA
jgi:hypothetical protein